MRVWIRERLRQSRRWAEGLLCLAGIGWLTGCADVRLAGSAAPGGGALSESGRARVKSMTDFYAVLMSAEQDGRREALLTLLDFNPSSELARGMLGDEIRGGEAFPAAQQARLAAWAEQPAADVEMALLWFAAGRKESLTDTGAYSRAVARRNAARGWVERCLAGETSGVRPGNLLSVLLHYGILSCDLGLTAAADEDWARWECLTRERAGAERAMLCEAAAFFYTDLFRETQEDALREAWNAAGELWRRRLAECLDFPVTPVELRRRLVSLEALGMPEAGEALLHRQLALNGNAPEFRHELALWLMRHGRLPEAERNLRLLLLDFPGREAYRRSLGEVWLLAGEYRRALAVWMELAQAAPLDGEVVTYLGAALAGVGDWESALRVLDQVAKRRTPARLLVLRCLLELGELERARSVADELADESGHWGRADLRALADLLYDLARLGREQRDLQRCVAFFRRAALWDEPEMSRKLTALLQQWKGVPYDFEPLAQNDAGERAAQPEKEERERNENE